MLRTVLKAFRHSNLALDVCSIRGALNPHGSVHSSSDWVQHSSYSTPKDHLASRKMFEAALLIPRTSQQMGAQNHTRADCKPFLQAFSDAASNIQPTVANRFWRVVGCVTPRQWYHSSFVKRCTQL